MAIEAFVNRFLAPCPHPPDAPPAPVANRQKVKQFLHLEQSVRPRDSTGRAGGRKSAARSGRSRLSAQSWSAPAAPAAAARCGPSKRRHTYTRPGFPPRAPSPASGGPSPCGRGPGRCCLAGVGDLLVHQRLVGSHLGVGPLEGLQVAKGFLIVTAQVLASDPGPLPLTMPRMIDLNRLRSFLSFGGRLRMRAGRLV